MQGLYQLLQNGSSHEEWIAPRVYAIVRDATDSYAKAKGLAQFAAKHAMDFGRIEVIRLVGKEIKRLDLMDATNRKRVLAVDSNAALDLIFGISDE